MDYLMGIDLGSTSLKAVVYDLEGNAVAGGSRKTELFHPSREHPEWAVWQPEQIWQGAAAASREAVARLDDPRRIKAVAVTGMGMDGLPIDAEGRWLYPMISWHDPRTGPQFEWWKRHVTAEKVFAIGGNPLWPINSALRILWMAENEPEILARADKWLLIEDFLNFMLCGRRATDYSMASCTLLFDQRRLSWSEELLELSGIDRRLLPEPLPSGTPLGEVTAEAAAATRLPQGTPVVLGGHDHLCGALPVGGFRPGVVLNVTGTWDTVLAAAGRPVLSPGLGQMGMTVQAHVARGVHAVWGSNVAGAMLEWYREQFGPGAAGREGDRSDLCEAPSGPSRQIGPVPLDAPRWDELMAAAAASPPGARRVMFLPHMSGASCPVVDPKSLGAFVGLSSRATAGDVLRAMIEGLNYQLLDVMTALQSGIGSGLEKLIVVGGATRNPFWMQNKADVTGRPIEVPGIEEATPLGAAILAGIGLGLYRDEEDAFQRVRRPGAAYVPDPAVSARYAEGFEIYRQLYPALAPISARLFADDGG